MPADIDAYFAPLADGRAGISSRKFTRHEVFARGRKAAEHGDFGAAIRLGEVLPPHRRGRFAAPRPGACFWSSSCACSAVLWVVQGLLQWSAVLLPREPLFDAVTPVWGAAVIFFAILDLVAAVGLWLATPWGGVIWLFGAIAQIFVALAIPGFFSMMWIGANIALILIYFALTWQARPVARPVRQAEAALTSDLFLPAKTHFTSLPPAPNLAAG